MTSKSRQEKILDILRAQGYVTVKYLINELHYSSATINRDLNELQNQQLIVRSYGGVELTRSTYIPIFFRTHKMQYEKRLIGKTAASFVQDGDTVFIDGSTTAQCMEQYLASKNNLTVITNNIILAASLSKNGIKVICLGGEIAEAPCMLYSPETVMNACRYKVDKMFFATDSASHDGKIASGLYDLLFQAVAQNAKEIFYLIDHKKIDKRFDTIFCDFSFVDYVISDYEFDTILKQSFEDTKFVLAK